MAAVPGPTGIDGIWLDDHTSQRPNPALQASRKLSALGQTGNTVAGNVANQAVGVVALPALAAGATGTVTITNSLITTASLIWLTVARGTTTAGAGAVGTVLVALRPPGSGSVVVDVTNLGSAATLSTDYIANYWIVN